jgi:hypothetical protein
LNSRRPSVLLVAAKWWPLAARLAIALVRHRCRVRVVCPAGHMLTHISGLDRVDRYSGLDSLACLRRSLREFEPDIIVPCDDGVVAQLHALYEQQPSMREAIARSLGAPENYSIVSSRYKLLSTAMELGISVPKTDMVTSQRRPRRLARERHIRERVEGGWRVGRQRGENYPDRSGFCRRLATARRAPQHWRGMETHGD